MGPVCAAFNKADRAPAHGQLQPSDSELQAVIGIDERFAAVAAREHQLAAHDRGVHEVLAEVLHEPRATHDGDIGAGAQ